MIPSLSAQSARHCIAHMQALRGIPDRSRKWHCLVWVTAMAPLILLLSFLIFPILEKWNLGYPQFHLSSMLVFVFAGCGVILWALEGRYRGGWMAWVMLAILLATAGGAVCAFWMGDFYWAFSRGYFLD